VVDDLTEDEAPGRLDPDHLLAALERLNTRIGEVMARQTAAAGVDLRGSQGRILHLIGRNGTRPTDLAQGSGITKQAMGKRLQDLEERGLVRTAPDPRDGRAVLVHLTPTGRRISETLARCVSDLEVELETRVGTGDYAAFRAVLDALGR
jgi:DNA-binding MarR family transcriptional regulator